MKIKLIPDPKMPIYNRFQPYTILKCFSLQQNNKANFEEFSTLKIYPHEFVSYMS